jgi:hypothetical protein
VAHGGAYPAGGGYPHPGDDDLHGAASAAASHAPEDEDFFSNVIGKLLQNKSMSQVAEEDIDEEGTPFSLPLSPPAPPYFHSQNHHPLASTIC